jgi:hypothetical protein
MIEMSALSPDDGIGHREAFTFDHHYIQWGEFTGVHHLNLTVDPDFADP